jgi:peptide/nickel transport system substrate-binding protein
VGANARQVRIDACGLDLNSEAVAGMSKADQQRIGAAGGVSRRQLLRMGAWAGLALAGRVLARADRCPQLATAGQSEQTPQPGGTLTMWIGADPPNFDVHQNSTHVTQHVTAPCYNNLVQYDPLSPNRIIPDLAERWEVTPDGMRYTFHLVQGVKFHDGQPFTSADVKVSLDRIRQPPAGVVSLRREAFEAVDDILAPDLSTVIVVLKQPNASLLAQLAGGHMAIYPRHVLDKEGDMKRTIVGTGPFKLKKYSRGLSIELERNPDYFVQGRPYLDGMTIFIIPDPNSAYAAFRTGRLLMLRLLEVSLGKRLEQELGAKVVLQRTAGYRFRAFHMNVSRRPWDDIRVRQAVSLAIDRQASIRVVSDGEGVVGGCMPPTSTWGLAKEELQSVPGYGPDIEANRVRGRQLLAQAGFPEGFKTSMLTRLRPSAERLAVFLRDQLAKIGIEASLDVQENASAYDAMHRKVFDTAPWEAAFAVADPDSVFSEFFVCKAVRNYASLCLPDVDELFRQQSQTLNPRERQKLVHEMERRVLHSHGCLLLHWGNYLTAHWPQVRNWIQHPSLYNNQRMQDVWLAKV